MARIAGVNLPNQKRLEIGLTYIYGIGQSTAQKICKDLELDPDEKIKDLTDDEITKRSAARDNESTAEADEIRYMIKHPGPDREFADWANRMAVSRSVFRRLPHTSMAAACRRS